MRGGCTADFGDATPAAASLYTHTLPSFAAVPGPPDALPYHFKNILLHLSIET